MTKSRKGRIDMAIQKKAIRKVAAPKTAPREIFKAGVAEKIIDVRSKISEVYTGEEASLIRILKETEEFTRNIVSIEMEIKRQRLLQNDLFENKKKFVGELKLLDTENTQLANEYKEIEKEHKEARDQNQRSKNDIDDLGDEISQLESERKELDNNINKMNAKNTKLRDDVERLQKLKEEYLKSIAKFKEIREELIP